MNKNKARRNRRKRNKNFESEQERTKEEEAHAERCEQNGGVYSKQNEEARGERFLDRDCYRFNTKAAPPCHHGN